MIAKYKKAEAKLYQELKRFPSTQEIADEMKIKEEKVNLLEKIKDDAISLETPLSGDEEKDTLIDFIEDKKVGSLSSRIEEENLREELKEILSSCLNPREEKILAMRFGLEDEITHTLEETGKAFGVTRERIRQIEAKTLEKLRRNPRIELLK
jgi:RNA polymerase primary sigma factor